MKFNNIELTLNKSSYFNEVIDPAFLNSDGIFCSETIGFHGWSFAFTESIYQSLVPGGRHKIEPYTLQQIMSTEVKVNSPAKISTPVIKNNRTEAKALMSEILAVCRKNKFRKIVLTHFIKINKNKHDLNLLGILDSLKENDLNFALTIVLTVDENNIESFQAIVDNFNTI